MIAPRASWASRYGDLAVVAIAAIVARAAAQIAVGFYVSPEAWEYDTLARNLVAGNGYVIEHDGTTHRAFTFPLYPLLLAGVYAVAGPSPTAVGLLQVALGAVLAALVYLFAIPMGRPVAILAALGAATHPGLLIYAAKIHALNLHAVLATALALVARLALQRPDLRTALIAGITTGVASLERPTFLPTIGLALGIGGWRRGDPRVALTLLAVWIALTAAFVAPWLVRNAVAVGAPVLTTTSNEALWRGNNPLATGGNAAADGRPMLEASPEMRDRVFGRPDVVQNEEFGRAALAYMSADPVRSAAWTVRKLFQFWGSGPHVGTNYPARWTQLYTAYYVAVVVLAAAALMVGRAIVGGASLAAIALTVVPTSLLQAVYYVEGRHRWEVEPLLLVLAAAGAVAIARRMLSR